MNDREGRRTSSGINVGDVQGTGIVIGHESSVSIKFDQSSVQRDAIALLDEFIRLLETQQSSVADAPEIRESAAAVRDELAGQSPRWPIVRGVLKGIAAGVTGVSALADAINGIQALIAHLPT